MASAGVLASVAMGSLALTKCLPLHLLIVVFVAKRLLGLSKYAVSDVAVVAVVAVLRQKKKR
eukprot:9858644-Ditylum_brightwellii.AAC.1